MEGIIKRHIKLTDENVTFSFQNCEYKAKQKRKLKIHKESVHGNVTYACDQNE